MRFITPANAKNLSVLGVEARKRNRAIRATNPTPAASFDSGLVHNQTPVYVSRRLSRVRKQLDMLDKRIEDEVSKDGSIDINTGEPRCCDGQLLNWLCQAQDRLAEQERILDGRPLPGSRKPTTDTPRRRDLPRLVPEPQPVAVKPSEPEPPKPESV